MSGFVEPVTLTGERWVSLEPLSREHVPEIAAASADGDCRQPVVHGRAVPDDRRRSGWTCGSVCRSPTPG